MAAHDSINPEPSTDVYVMQLHGAGRDRVRWCVGWRKSSCSTLGYLACSAASGALEAGLTVHVMPVIRNVDILVPRPNHADSEVPQKASTAPFGVAHGRLVVARVLARLQHPLLRHGHQARAIRQPALLVWVFRVVGMDGQRLGAVGCCAFLAHLARARGQQHLVLSAGDGTALQCH